MSKFVVGQKVRIVALNDQWSYLDGKEATILGIEGDMHQIDIGPKNISGKWFCSERGLESIDNIKV